jgi:hypothetical protein
VSDGDICVMGLVIVSWNVLVASAGEENGSMVTASDEKLALR